MDPLTSALIRRFGPPEDAPPAVRKGAFGLLEGWIGLVLNAALFGLKLALGLQIGSVALIADAVHTAADSVTSGVLIVGSRAARQPADAEHPYGHGRAELVAALVIAVLLGVAGIEFLQGSVHQVLHPEAVEAPWWAVGVVLACAAIKEWNARFALALGRASGSKAIEADAWHHRSDVFATALVAVGIVGAHFGLPWLDGVMGLAVSGVIFWTAYAIAREAIDPLIGQAPSAAEIDEVREGALAVDDVEGVHDIVIHRYGDVRLVSLHVETSDKLDPLRMHTIAELVQDTIAGGRDGHVVVHVDPIDRDHPRYDDVDAALEGLVAADDRLSSFHDLRIVGEASCFNVIVDVVPVTTVSAADELAAELTETIRERTGAHAVVLHVEPAFAYDGRGRG